MLGPLVALGPQRPTPNLPTVLAHHAPGPGHVVAITAGWRYDESETGLIEAVIGEPVKALPLYAWYEELSHQTPALPKLWSERQEQILSFKQLYRVRLRYGLGAVGELLDALWRDEGAVRPELEAAIAAVREVDASFLRRIAELDARWPALTQPWEHADVRARHEEAASILDGARAVLIAGGHVGVLRNRLLFFGLAPLLRAARERGCAVIAWSAGVMALAERVVLFYDDPPEGPSYPELFDAGLGVIPGLVALPHARRRLRLEDPERVARLATRFLPHRCVGFENQGWLSYEDGCWVGRGDPDAAVVLTPEGALLPWPEGPCAS